MRQQNVNGMGTIQVEKEVLAEIISNAVSEINGVNLIKRNLFEELAGLTGRKLYPGVKIKFTDKNEVIITAKVTIPFGVNVPEVSLQIQDVIRRVLEKMIEINIKEINVIIYGIERGQ